MKDKLPDVVASVFAPLIQASGRTDLADKLRTEKIDASEQEQQYKRYNSVKLLGTNAAHLPGGGFLCLYEHADGRYLAFSVPNLNEADEQHVTDWSVKLGFEQENIDQSTFLFLCHYLRDLYSIKPAYRKLSAAADVLDVLGDDYQGHAFSDLIDFYQTVYVFRVPADNALYDADVSHHGFNLCCSFSGARSRIITQQINAAVIELGTYEHIPKDNLFQALTANLSRHYFLEMYRCIEALYYFPWVLELKDKGGIASTVSELKEYCRTTLNWREREEPSIRKIFGSVTLDGATTALEKEIELFKTFLNSRDFKRESLGKEIYRIRNNLVHHEDYENPQRIDFTVQQWEQLSIYVTLILLCYSREHSQDFS